MTRGRRRRRTLNPAGTQSTGVDEAAAAAPVGEDRDDPFAPTARCKDAVKGELSDLIRQHQAARRADSVVTLIQAVDPSRYGIEPDHTTHSTAGPPR